VALAALESSMNAVKPKVLLVILAVPASLDPAKMRPGVNPLPWRLTMVALAADAVSSNKVRPPLRLVMLALPALLVSKKDVAPPLLSMVANQAVVRAWKMVAPPVC
jgi:hypothetical protein